MSARREEHEYNGKPFTLNYKTQFQTNPACERMSGAIPLPTLNISKRLYAVIVLAAVSLVALSGIALYYQYESLYSQRVNRLSLMTEAAVGILKHHH
jgi:hypothetical protein